MAVILLAILVPMLLAAVAAVLPGRPRALAALPLAGGLAGLAALAAGLSMAPLAIARPWVGPFTLAFGIDAWRLLLLGFAVAFELACGLWLLTASAPARPRLLAASLLVAFGSAAGVVLADNVLLLLIFWETFLLALYGAIASGGEGSERTAQKALIIGGSSDFLMVLGLMAYLGLGGSASLGAPLPTSSSPTALIAFVLIFLGAGAKAGMFPFHTWIPEAATAMPAGAFAALPASLEKLLGIAFLATVTTRMFALDGRARLIMLVFAVATVFAVLAPALVETSLKRILALTAIAPVGFMVAGMAMGPEAGVAGALVYMLAHATYKSGMFLAAGSFEARAGSDRLAALAGIGRRMPVCGMGFALAAIAAVSLPPTAGFLAKELVFESLAHHHAWLPLGLLGLGAALLVAVVCKLVAVVFAPGPVVVVAAPAAAERLPVLVLGAGALLSGGIVTGAARAFALPLGADDTAWVLAPWHLSPLLLVSLAVWLVGGGLFLAARRSSGEAATAFEGLRRAPLLGAGLTVAAGGRLDAYEIGLRATDGLTRVVFRYFERVIDQAVDRLIALGRGLSGAALSRPHNGLYANYLAWTVAGFALVLALLLF